MSIYADDEEENQDIIVVNGQYEKFVLRGKTCALSAFSHIPISHQAPQEITYFQKVKKNNTDFIKNNQLKPDQIALDYKRRLNINDEESTRIVPLLTSSLHGHYLRQREYPYERDHARKPLIRSEFFRSNGIPFYTEL